MPSEATFDLIFRTKSELSGINKLAEGIQARLAQVKAFNAQISNGASVINSALQTAAAFVAFSALKSYVRDAEQAEVASGKLAQALGNTNQQSAEYRRELDQLAKSLEKKTGIDDDVITGVEAQLIGFGAQRAQMKELTGLTLDFAEVMGTDALSAATVLGRALQGDEVVLRGMRIEVNQQLPLEQQLAELIVKLSVAIGGQAEAANRATGGLRGTRAELKDLGEEIGKVILEFEKPFLRGFVDGLKETVEWLQKYSGALRETQSGQDNFINSRGKITGQLLPFIAALGSIRLITWLIGPLRSLFLLFTGISFLKFISEMTSIDGIVRLFTGSATTGTGAVARFTIAVRALGVAALLVAAGFAAMKAIVAVNDWLGTQAWWQDIEVKFEEKRIGISRFLANKFGGGFIDELKAAEKRLAELKQRALDLRIPPPRGEATEKPAFVDPWGPKPGAAAALTIAERTKLVATITFELANAQQLYQIRLRETAFLEASGAITAEEARRRNIQATREQIVKLEELQQRLREMIKQFEAAGDVRGVRQLTQQLQDTKLKTTELKIALLDQTFFGQIRGQIRQLATEWGNLGLQIGRFFTNTFQTAAAGASRALTGLIFRTNDWRQAFAQAAQAIVQNLIQIVIQWILSRTIMAALNKVFGALDAKAATALAGKAAAAWAPAATSASIATYGVAAGTGLAAYLGAIGAGVAGATAAANVGGFIGHEGGIVGGRRGSRSIMAMMSMFARGQLSASEVFAILLKGEGVFTQEQMAGMTIHPRAQHLFSAEQRDALGVRQYHDGGIADDATDFP